MSNASSAGEAFLALRHRTFAVVHRHDTLVVDIPESLNLVSHPSTHSLTLNLETDRTKFGCLTEAASTAPISKSSCLLLTRPAATYSKGFQLVATGHHTRLKLVNFRNRELRAKKDSISRLTAF